MYEFYQGSDAGQSQDDGDQTEQVLDAKTLTVMDPDGQPKETGVGSNADVVVKQEVVRLFCPACINKTKEALSGSHTNIK